MINKIFLILLLSNSILFSKRINLKYSEEECYIILNKYCIDTDIKSKKGWQRTIKKHQLQYFAGRYLPADKQLKLESCLLTKLKLKNEDININIGERIK